MIPRLIPFLTYADGALINTRKFEFDCSVGVLDQNIKSQNFQGADEICVLNIGAVDNRSGTFEKDLAESLCENFLPISAGGAVRSIDDVDRLFRCGIEKVLINQLFFSEEGRQQVREINNRYGRQAITRIIDVAREGADWVLIDRHTNSQLVYQSMGRLLAGIDYSSFGELFVQRVDLDGTMLGWDRHFLLDLATVSVPVIVGGGCGSYEDIYNAFDAGVSGVAMASFLLLGDHNCHRVKAFLRSRGMELRT